MYAEKSKFRCANQKMTKKIFRTRKRHIICGKMARGTPSVTPLCLLVSFAAPTRPSPPSGQTGTKPSDTLQNSVVSAALNKSN
jgi:hypothetical protein